jgi:hypothetical protein
MRYGGESRLSVINMANCADIQMREGTVEGCGQASFPEGLFGKGAEGGNGEGMCVAGEEEPRGRHETRGRRSQERHFCWQGWSADNGDVVLSACY